jgi:hypothetical protein
MKRVGGLVAVAILTAAHHAEAAGTEEHRALMVAGQLLENDGKLLRAAELFRECDEQLCEGEAPECTTIRSFCRARYAAVRAVTPSVEVDVRDELGVPKPGAVVEVDGHVLRHGEHIALDPGTYVARAAFVGRQATQRFTLATGQKDQSFTLRLVLDLSAHRTARPLTALQYVLGGVTLGGVLATAGFGVAWAVLRGNGEACAPYCASGGRDAYSFATVGFDVAWIATLAAGTGTLVSYLARPTVRVPYRVDQP